MKKILGLLAGIVLLATPLKADTGSAFQIVWCAGTTTCTQATGTATIAVDASTSPTYDISHNSFVRAQFASAAGSSAVVVVDIRSSSSMPWTILTSVTNPHSADNDPASAADYVTIPQGMQIRFRITTYVSGTLRGILETHLVAK